MSRNKQDAADITCLLEGVTALVGARPDWWYAQLQNCESPEAETALSEWFSLSSQAATPEMAYEGLRQLNDLVDRKWICWPQGDEGCVEQAILSAVVAVVREGERARRHAFHGFKY